MKVVERGGSGRPVVARIPTTPVVPIIAACARNDRMNGLIRSGLSF
jgi:hypothetical protein